MRSGTGPPLSADLRAGYPGLVGIRAGSGSRPVAFPSRGRAGPGRLGWAVGLRTLVSTIGNRSAMVWPLRRSDRLLLSHDWDAVHFLRLVGAGGRTERDPMKLPPQDGRRDEGRGERRGRQPAAEQPAAEQPPAMRKNRQGRSQADRRAERSSGPPAGPAAAALGGRLVDEAADAAGLVRGDGEVLLGVVAARVREVDAVGEVSAALGGGSGQATRGARCGRVPIPRRAGRRAEGRGGRRRTS